MAKVTGPLFSIEARGKIADAMVFFPWKGRNVVREWKKPSNPQTAAQGDARTILGGLGRSVSPVAKTSLYAQYAREVADAGQTWVSQFVKYMRDTHMKTVANFDDYITDVAALGDYADWVAKSATVGLVLFYINPRTAAQQFQAYAMLYALAEYGFDQYTNDNEKFKTAPYTANPSGWNAASMQLMIDDFAAI